MWTIIGVGIIFFVISMFMSLIEDDGTVGFVMRGTLLTIFGCFIGLLISVVIGRNGTYEYSHTEELISLQDNTRYFMRRSEHEYSMYVNHEDGFRMKNVPTSNVTVKFSSNHPKIETYVAVSANDWTKLFGTGIRRRYTDSCVIYVPQGTIQEEFNLDSK